MKFIKKIFKNRQDSRKVKSFRNYMASMVGRLTSDWVSGTMSPNEAISKNISILRARSREQYNNNGYIKKYITLCSQNIVGPSGIILQSRVRDNKGSLSQKVNHKVENAFKVWGRMGACDVSNKLSWLECQRLFVETVAKDGEAIVRIHKKYPNDFGFALEFLEAENLDITLKKNFNDGRRIRMGIELDSWNKPLAYYLKKNPYYESGEYFSDNEYERVPAEDIIHGFIVERPGQLRGIPWAHAALLQLHMLNAYQISELVASRVSACKMGFFKTNDMFDPELLADEIIGDTLVKDATPAKFEMLPPGTDFEPFDPQHPTDAFSDFSKTCLRAASSALGVSYNELANDLEGVNFSSIRAGLISEREHWKILQEWMISTFCEPIFSKWLINASALGHIPDIPVEKLDADHWQARRWDWVDPEKDRKGTKLSLEMMEQSWSENVRRTGGDPIKVLEQVKDEKDMFGQNGLEDFFKQIYQTPNKNGDKSGEEREKPEDKVNRPDNGKAGTDSDG